MGDAVYTVENITFAQLRAFALVAKTGSFARAADEMSISQPAVSEQVKLLEGKLGKQLLNRRRGTTPTLTEAGRLVLEETDTIFESLARIKRTDEEDAGPTILTLSVSPKMREMYFSRVLPEFYSSHPNITIQLPLKLSLKEELDALDSGDLDLVMSTLPKDVIPSSARLLKEVPVTFIASPDTMAQLEAKEHAISDFEMILNVRNEEAQRWTLDYLERMGLASVIPPTFIEFTEVTCQFVKDRRCIGFLAEHQVKRELDSGTLVALDLDIQPWHRCIMRSPHAPPLAKVFEDYLSKAIP